MDETKKGTRKRLRARFNGEGGGVVFVRLNLNLSVVGGKWITMQALYFWDERE